MNDDDLYDLKVEDLLALDLIASNYDPKALAKLMGGLDGYLLADHVATAEHKVKMLIDFVCLMESGNYLVKDAFEEVARKYGYTPISDLTPN